MAKSRLGGTPQTEPPPSRRAAQTGRVARLSYAAEYIIEASFCTIHCQTASGSVHSQRQPEKANAILSVRDLRREQIVWIGGLASRQGRTIVKTGQMDVI